MKRQPNRRGPCPAFTLIEMLTVLAIMGIIAAMVLNLGKAASQKKTMAKVEADKNKLIMMINSYQSKLNYYPPDNGLLGTVTSDPTRYDEFSAINPLLYELTGGTNQGGGQTLCVFNNTNLSATAYTAVFGTNRGGIANADPLEPRNFYNPGPAPEEYGPYTNINGAVIYGLVVPAFGTNLGKTNFWHYDSSTGNRHNLNSYDLWAEFTIGSKNGAPILITNGNW